MKATPVGPVIVTVFLLIATGLAAAALPLGTYTTDIAREDIPASLRPQFVPLLAGRWEITFHIRPNGRFSSTKDGAVAVTGEYAVTQDRIAFYKENGPLACTGSQVPGNPGVYRWSFDGKMLTFTKVADECAGRAAVLTAHPWAKRE